MRWAHIWALIEAKNYSFYISGTDYIFSLYACRITLIARSFLFVQAGKVKLKCLATIAGLYWKTAEIQLAQEHPKLSQVLQVEGENVRLHCKENPIYVFLFRELRSLSPNFHIHASVSDLYPCFPGLVHIFTAAE